MVNLGNLAASFLATQRNTTTSRFIDTAQHNHK